MLSLLSVCMLQVISGLEFIHLFSRRVRRRKQTEKIMAPAPSTPIRSRREVVYHERNIM